MFRNILSNTPLTNDMANPAFPNITGEAYQGDTSMVATLRALMPHRMGEGDSIFVRYRTVNYDGDKSSARNIVKSVVGDVSAANTMTIYNVRGDKETTDIVLDAIQELFLDVYPGYEVCEKPAGFFASCKLRMHCFINRETKSVLFFVQTMDIRKLHLLEATVLPSMPWYFDGKQTSVAPEEMELIESLLNKDGPDKYLDVLRKFAAQYDFRTPRIRQLLTGFETRFEKIEKENMTRVIKDIDTKIKEYERVISEKLKERRDLCIKLLGLECKIEQTGEDSEIMEYFLCNRNLHLINVSDEYMDFIATGYLGMFDPEVAERTIANRTSYFYKGDSEQNKNMKMLMKAIFLYQTIKVRFAAKYRLYLSGTVEGLRIDEMPGDVDGFMPNPHIQRHGCLGGHRERISEAMRHGDYIGAIEQAIASCKNLNLSDSTVMNGWMSDYFYRDSDWSRGLELPDGRVVKPAEAIAWLKEQEGADGKKKKAAKEE